MLAKTNMLHHNKIGDLDFSHSCSSFVSDLCSSSCQDTLNARLIDVPADSLILFFQEAAHPA